MGLQPSKECPGAEIYSIATVVISRGISSNVKLTAFQTVYAQLHELRNLLKWLFSLNIANARYRENLQANLTLPILLNILNANDADPQGSFSWLAEELKEKEWNEV